ncbi:hypothetical protein LPJ64_005514 [Coemansia asiatica]|uniref:Anaphase-promoting complex subunit 10 n=1 Tax=Coemansia asiatica TaxID=1052880 RepID=A0A9W7XEA9_9FUNG|nr:hypothetical protein LPJ64_005514 [Coemansia asiatica]KAJ2886200.1 hypothetical protein FB639_001626 [Coemansia asiatica]
MNNLPDISNQAHWTVSTSKHGFGVSNLHDNNPDTFWQSDGQLPHSISIKFPNRQPIHTIALYLDYDKDESYTPCCVRVYAGTSKYDMQLVNDHQFTKEPRGWVHLRLADISGPLLLAHFLYIELPMNYESGRDVHVRLAKVLGPAPKEEKFRKERILPFTTEEFYMYDTLR